MDMPKHLKPIIEAANKRIAEGGDVYFKFTCAKCGIRQTFETKNTFYPEGKCEECSHITDLLNEKANVNFLYVAALTPKGVDFLKGYGGGNGG